MKKYLVPSFFFTGYIALILFCGWWGDTGNYQVNTEVAPAMLAMLAVTVSGYWTAKWIFLNHPVLGSFLIVLSIAFFGYVAGRLWKGEEERS